jgi:hypothetical protein
MEESGGQSSGQEEGTSVRVYYMVHPSVDTDGGNSSVL